MKPGQIKRRKQKAKQRRYKSLTDIDKANAIMFWEAAREQGECAVCGDMGRDWEAHHVVERSYLKANFLPQFNQDNSLRVCEEPCHGQHTRRFKKIPLRCLTDANIAYAFRELGAFADDYLRQRYDGADPRVEQLARSVAA